VDDALVIKPAQLEIRQVYCHGTCAKHSMQVTALGLGRPFTETF
jgi:hypothetical protein